MEVFPLTADDLFTYNDIQCDPFTATFGFGFYGRYLSQHSPMLSKIPLPGLEVAGYMIGKQEGRELTPELQHGHVSAVTVAPVARAAGVARQLMGWLKGVSERLAEGRFVDLFVKADNDGALAFYRKLGYVTYRTVKNYYTHERKNAYDLRLPTKLDPECLSTQGAGREIDPSELEWD